LDTQKLFVASFVQSASPEHSTQVPAPAPLARQTGFVANLAEHALDAANWQPAQALDTQKLFVASFMHWLSAEHSTHCPAEVPVVAHTFLPSVCAEHPVAPLVLQPVQTFATQKPLAASFVHWLSAAHSTHRPADVPVVAQVVLPSVRAEHPVAPLVLQPVHAFATQKPLATSFVHWLSAKHSTHWPADVPAVAQVVLPSVRAEHPVAPAVLQPVQV
jgi:hypothetical protein